MDGQKCERTQCSCYVDLGELFCGNICRKAAETADADDGPHQPCGCRHTECATGASI